MGRPRTQLHCFSDLRGKMSQGAGGRAKLRAGGGPAEPPTSLCSACVCVPKTVVESHGMTHVVFEREDRERV